MFNRILNMPTQSWEDKIIENTCVGDHRCVEDLKLLNIFKILCWGLGTSEYQTFSELSFHTEAYDSQLSFSYPPPFELVTSAGI